MEVCFYIVRFLYAQRWKDSAPPTMEGGMVKMMVKLTSLIREKTIAMFIAEWKPLADILCETEKLNS